MEFRASNLSVSILCIKISNNELDFHLKHLNMAIRLF